MPRHKGHTGTVVSRRAAVEDLMALLVAMEIRLPYARLRVFQALQRTGLEDLLVPALEEMETVEQILKKAKACLKAFQPQFFTRAESNRNSAQNPCLRRMGAGTQKKAGTGREARS